MNTTIGCLVTYCVNTGQIIYLLCNVHFDSFQFEVFMNMALINSLVHDFECTHGHISVGHMSGNGTTGF